MRLAALTLLLLAACVSLEQETAQVRNAWQGASFDEVVRRWGAPVRSGSLSDGAKVHTWVAEQASGYRDGPSVGVGVFGGGRGGGVGVGMGFPFGGSSAVTMARCERTFTFRDDAVAEQSWTGDAGFCNIFKR